MSLVRTMPIRSTLVAGALYGAIGIVTANVGGGVALRWVAWALSAVVFATHIIYERRRSLRGDRFVALTVAAAAGFGAFLLACGASVHRMLTAAPGPHILLTALILWPIITAIPAFVVAFVALRVVNPTGPLPPDHAGEGSVRP